MTTSENPPASPGYMRAKLTLDHNDTLMTKRALRSLGGYGLSSLLRPEAVPRSLYGHLNSVYSSARGNPRSLDPGRCALAAYRNDSCAHRTGVNGVVYDGATVPGGYTGHEGPPTNHRQGSDSRRARGLRGLNSGGLS